MIPVVMRARWLLLPALWVCTHSALAAPGATAAHATPASEPAAASQPVAAATQPAVNPAPLAADVVAVVDGVVITSEQLEARLRTQSDKARHYYSTPAHRQEFLDDLIEVVLLAQEAKRRGLDQDPVVALSYESALAETLLSQHSPNDPVTEDEAKQYYQDHMDEYVKPDRVRVSQILLPGGDKTLADKLVAEIAAGDDATFRQLVDKFSEDSISKGRAGDLEEITRDDADHKRDDGELLPAAVVDAAFAIPVVGGTAIVPASDGIHILLLTARYSPSTRSYEDARDSIMKKLATLDQQETVGDLVQSLRSEATIQVNTSVLQKVLDP
jgi:parvulin-like peptidyl-prolyl isomerase